jgi:site-specific recombinase XerD
MPKKSYFLPVLSEFFSQYLPQTKGLSANTVRSYKHAFRLFLQYICEEKSLPIEKIEFRHLEKGVAESWLNWLADIRNCSPKTRNQRLAALVTFARFAVRKDFDGALAFSSDVEYLPKAKDRKKDRAVHFSKDEMSVLLRIPDSFKNIGKRDKALLSTLYASGARAQELCDLTVGDVRFGEKTTLTLHGKGDKTRTIIIPEQSALLLKTYMQQFNLLGNDKNVRKHVFSSQTHEHMSTSCVEAIVKKYVKQAKKLRPDLFKENYSPHSFRHSIAMHMLESGIPLPVIKTFLGHVSISSTMIYASADYELVCKYLRNKDPYAEQDEPTEQLNTPILPDFLQ